MPTAAVLFVSDLHLSPARPDVAAQFRQFLLGTAGSAAALYILGDLFDYWPGDDALDDPFHAGIADALADCGTRLPVSLMHGNRDFLLGPAFARAARLTLVADPLRLDIGGMDTLLMHGDTLCTDDADYQAFRAQVRAPQWREAFLGRPLAERIRIIENLRAQSEMQKQEKQPDIMDVNDAAVREVLAGSGCERLIHGHTHRPARHQLDVEGRRCERWVLGDWCVQANWLSCGPAGCTWHTARA